MRHFLLFASLLSACADTRGPHGPTPDGGTAPPPPPPGQLSLAVEAAGWVGTGELVLQVRVGNGVGGVSAPLDPSYFVLTTDAGFEVTGSLTSLPLPTACRADLAVAAGASASCQLFFQAASGNPTQVSYRPPMRMASAPVDACSPSAPMGLCAFGTVCSSGSCGVSCSPSAPTAPCADPSMLCQAGTCVARCSSSNPTGACETGVCNAGVCDVSCHMLVGTDSCLTCLQGVMTSCPGLNQSNCPNCANCLIGGMSSCDCAAGSMCAGCPGASAALDCIFTNCPVCAG